MCIHFFLKRGNIFLIDLRSTIVRNFFSVADLGTHHICEFFKFINFSLLINNINLNNNNLNNLIYFHKMKKPGTESGCGIPRQRKSTACGAEKETAIVAFTPINWSTGRIPKWLVSQTATSNFSLLSEFMTEPPLAQAMSKITIYITLSNNLIVISNLNTIKTRKIRFISSMLFDTMYFAHFSEFQQLFLQVISLYMFSIHFYIKILNTPVQLVLGPQNRNSMVVDKL